MNAFNTSVSGVTVITDESELQTVGVNTNQINAVVLKRPDKGVPNFLYERITNDEIQSRFGRPRNRTWYDLFLVTKTSAFAQVVVALSSDATNPVLYSVNFSATNDLGTWAADTSYQLGDNITVGDDTFYCVIAHTSSATDSSLGAPTIENTTLNWSLGNMIPGEVSFDSSLALSPDNYLIFTQKDGAVQGNIGISITDKNVSDKTFVINVHDKTNPRDIVESFLVSTEEDGVDIDGNEIFVTDVLEQSNIIDVVFDEEATIEDIFEHPAVYFQGGSRGSDPTEEDILKAWRVFAVDNSNRIVAENFLYGNYESLTAVEEAASLADKVDATIQFDLPFNPTIQTAIDEVKTIFNHKNTSFYYDSAQGKYKNKTVQVYGSQVAAQNIGNGLGFAPSGYVRGDHGGGLIGIQLISKTNIINDIEYDLLKSNKINFFLDTDEGLLLWEQTTRTRSVRLDRIKPVKIAYKLQKDLKRVKLPYIHGSPNLDDVESDLEDLLDSYESNSLIQDISDDEKLAAGVEFDGNYGIKFQQDPTNRRIYDVAVFVKLADTIERFNVVIKPV